MAFSGDAHLISDELKPRRTPEPASFGGSLLRPSVPDLSIIETSQTGAVSQLQPHSSQPPSSQPPPSLSHLSYNDWKQKTGSGTNAGMNVSRSSGMNEIAPRPPSVLGPMMMTSVGSSVSQERYDYQTARPQDGLPIAAGQPAGKTVSHADYRLRPTSAPAARPQYAGSDVGGPHQLQHQHPLSKSAPPARASNQHEYHGPVPLSSGSSYPVPSAVPPTYGQHPQPMGHLAPRSHPEGHFTHYQQAPRAPIQEPGPQNMNVQRHGNVASPRRNSEKAVSDLVVLPKQGPVKNHVNFANPSGSPVHHFNPHVMGFDSLHNTQCTMPTMRTVAPYSFGDQVCCSTSPHHMHQVHPCLLQHPAPVAQVSYDDLYKMVVAQNDQLKALQAQVDRLLLTQDNRSSAVSTPQAKKEEKLQVAVAQKSCQRVVSEEGTQTSDCETGEGDSQKMSIGVMTSFIHAVAYRGRVGRLDPESGSSNGNRSKQSKSPSSGDCSSSSLSPASNSAKSPTRCRDCGSKCKHQNRSKKHVSKRGMSKQKAEGTLSHSKESPSGNAVCPEGCNCNDPGVSAAITAVRGCQAVLASKAGVTAHNYSTFNGNDLPTVTEQIVSPMSSIHVDLHDYRSSSSDEESNGSQSDSSSEDIENSPLRGQGTGSKRNGWNCYSNAFGHVNKNSEEREVVNSSPDAYRAVAPTKQNDVSVSKRVAFEAQGTNVPSQNLKEMAIRYLKENHPEELATSAETKKSKKAQGEKVQEMAVYNMPTANMSFATFRYLERYNLLPDNFNPQQYLEATAKVHGFPNAHQEHLTGHPPNARGRKSSRASGKSKARPNLPPLDHNERLNPLQPMGNVHPRKSHPAYQVSPRRLPQPNTPTSKILDITTLRQQPKLL